MDYVTDPAIENMDFLAVTSDTVESINQQDNRVRMINRTTREDNYY